MNKQDLYNYLFNYYNENINMDNLDITLISDEINKVVDEFFDPNLSTVKFLTDKGTKLLRINLGINIEPISDMKELSEYLGLNLPACYNLKKYCLDQLLKRIINYKKCQKISSLELNKNYNSLKNMNLIQLGLDKNSSFYKRLSERNIFTLHDLLTFSSTELLNDKLINQSTLNTIKEKLLKFEIRFIDDLTALERIELIKKNYDRALNSSPYFISNASDLIDKLRTKKINVRNISDILYYIQLRNLDCETIFELMQMNIVKIQNQNRISMLQLSSRYLELKNKNILILYDVIGLNNIKELIKNGIYTLYDLLSYHPKELEKIIKLPIIELIKNYLSKYNLKMMDEVPFKDYHNLLLEDLDKLLNSSCYLLKINNYNSINDFVKYVNSTNDVVYIEYINTLKLVGIKVSLATEIRSTIDYFGFHRFCSDFIYKYDLEELMSLDISVFFFNISDFNKLRNYKINTLFDLLNVTKDQLYKIFPSEAGRLINYVHFMGFTLKDESIYLFNSFK